MNDNLESRGRRASDGAAIDCRLLAGKIGSDACDTIMLAVCRADQDGSQLTIAELADSTGLPLHEAFAALRTLEFGKIIHIQDDPADPFGARLSLRSDALKRLESLRAA